MCFAEKLWHFFAIRNILDDICTFRRRLFWFRSTYCTTGSLSQYGLFLSERPQRNRYWRGKHHHKSESDSSVYWMKWERIDGSNSLWEMFTNCNNVSNVSARRERKEMKTSATRKHKCSISENYISPCNLCSANLKYDGGNFLQTLLPLTALLKHQPNKSRGDIIILDCLVNAIKTRWPENGQMHVKSANNPCLLWIRLRGWGGRRGENGSINSIAIMRGRGKEIRPSLSANCYRGAACRLTEWSGWI